MIFLPIEKSLFCYSYLFIPNGIRGKPRCLLTMKGIFMSRTKRLRTIVIVLTMILNTGLSAENLGRILGILEPTGIEISDNELYILQGATIHVFSLPRLHPVRAMGVRGEGPGELKVTPWLSNAMILFPDHIILGSIDKYISFAKSGRILEEQRRNPAFTQVIPFEGIQAVRKRIVEEGAQYSTINIFNPETQSLKELYRQRFSAGRGEVDAVPDSIHFTVFGGLIYIDQSAEGFVVAAYDKSGALVSKINPPVKNIRLKDTDRILALEAMKEDPFINMNTGGWENYQKTTRINFPSYFPPIRDFVLSEGRIIVQTYLIQGDEEEYIFLDLEGNIKQRLFLPVSEKPCFTEEMMGTGVRYFAFSPDHYYRLIIREEWCELDRISLTDSFKVAENRQAEH